MPANITELLVAIAVGLLAVTFIDVFGSITSRKWKYNYAYLSPLSFAVYTAIGYYITPKFSMNLALILGSLVGMYDATIGWKLAILLNANMGSQKDAALKRDSLSRVIFMIIVATLFGVIGAMLAR